jgi:transposase-like protein
VGKRRVGRYPLEFRRMVVEQMNNCDNITALAQELGLERKLMYTWRAQLAEQGAADVGGSAGVVETREVQLERQVGQLKRALADKTLELDFFKGALQKVEARRRQRSNSGGKTSTTRSAK